MEQLIPLINKLQDVFNAIGHEDIDLPQIVVVGSQSSGKSSVLENIVGRDFLPRGSGIVTRRPLVLQLNYRPAQARDAPGKQEWGEFLHKPNEIFYDFNEIREEIQRETDRITGKNKGVSPIPINLKIYSPNVLNLTLVDLPGITRVPIGDQPTDIELLIRKMIMGYIEKKNAIVLAVTAANTDLSNSDSLQLARDVDPEGLRTLGVLTKIDIMDKGTDALDMLTGKVYPLKLGFIGVVNRSQQDIIQKKPIHQSLKEEQEFFNTHPLYRNIAGRCGTKFLAKTLNKILLNHIRETLPDLKVKINKLYQDAQAELASYGDQFLDTKNSKGALLLQIITKFSTDYRDSIDGKSTEISLNELCGGARINYIFNEIFGSCLNGIFPTEGLTMNDIRTAIRNATGPRAALFVPEVSFELLVKKQIMRLEEPSLQCVELVFDELQTIISHLESKELQRFINLKERVVTVVNEMLHNCRTPTKQMISNLIAVELAYINTNHPDFVGGGGAINSIFEKMAQNQNNQNQQQQQQQLQQNQQQQLQPQQLQQQQLQQQQQQLLQQQQQQQPPARSTAPSQPQRPGQPTPSPSIFSTIFPSSTTQVATQPSSVPNGNTNRQSKLPNKPLPNQAQQQPQRSQSGYSQYSSLGRERLEQPPATIKAVSVPTDREKFETELIKSLLDSYFDVVRKNIKDLVPKSIMHFLVNASKESIQNELVRQLYKEELFDELLEEAPAIAARRGACKKVLDVLRRANEILNEVRDFNVK